MTTLMTSLFFFYPFGALLIAAMPLSAKSHVPEMFFFYYGRNFETACTVYTILLLNYGFFRGQCCGYIPGNKYTGFKGLESGLKNRPCSDSSIQSESTLCLLSYNPFLCQL